MKLWVGGFVLRPAPPDGGDWRQRLAAVAKTEITGVMKTANGDMRKIWDAPDDNG